MIRLQGGMASNVVAPLARAHLDLRYTAENDLDAVLARIRAIIENESLPRTSGHIVAQTGTLPMAKTPAALLQAYQRSAAQVGFAVEGEFTGGAADSGITSSMGIPSPYPARHRAGLAPSHPGGSHRTRHA